MSEQLKNQTPKLDEASVPSPNLIVSNDPAGETSDSSNELVGQIVANHYEILGLIGTGGLGAVYKANHKLLRKTVAIKFLRPGKRLDQNAVVRFQREAQAAIGLSHEHIASVQEFGIHNEMPFLVMELVDGQSLAEIIEKEGALPSARYLPIFKQLLRALDYAHNQSVVHRDIKPENIIVSKNDSGTEHIKLIDFGLAKVVDNDELVDITKTGEIFGTPAYMSPEQCRGLVVDHRSDLYSASCVAHEMIFGAPPFTGQSSIDVILKQVSEEPKLRTTPQDANGLERVISRCLAKDKRSRYASANEMLTEVELIENGKPPQNTFYISRKLLHQNFVYFSLAILIFSCAYILIAMTGEKTVRSLSKGIREHPNEIVNYIDRAQLYAVRGDYDAAVNDIAAAEKIDPTSSKIKQLKSTYERLLNKERSTLPPSNRSEPR